MIAVRELARKRKFMLLILTQFLDDHPPVTIERRQTRQACSELNLKINNNSTSTFRDFYFNRIANMWSNILNDVRQAESIDSFNRELKSFYFKTLFNVFDGDNFRT